MGEMILRCCGVMYDLLVDGITLVKTSSNKRQNV